MAHRGLLIAIEGIDGAGKTTQVSAIAEALTDFGRQVVTSKEPTSGQYGQALRDSGKSGRLSHKKELELFYADRREHVENLINPSLKAGKVVIVDRYYFSMAAYQGARGDDWAKLLQKNEEFAPQPDILIFIDVEPKVGLSRIKQRGDIANDFEKPETLQRAAEIFREMKYPFRLVIDGRLPIQQITNKILDALHSGPLSDRPLWSKEDPPPRSNVSIWNAVDALTEQ